MTTYTNFLNSVETNSKLNASLITQNATWNSTVKNGQALPIYHGIFIAAQVFQVLLITDAVRLIFISYYIAHATIFDPINDHYCL
jgi:hypothetical protein